MKVIFGSVVYRAALEYLDDFLDSLDGQTFQEFEVLLVNDDLEDETLGEHVRKCANLSKKTTILKADEGQAIPLLRIHLLKEAKKRGGTLLILGDCDDFFSKDRVASAVWGYEPGFSFFYNEILNLEGQAVMPPMPGATESVRDIGECNYLGFTNTAVNLDKLDVAFLDSLREGQTNVFDWYFFSRLLLAGGRGKYLCRGKSYYRTHERNLAGEARNTEEARSRELQVKVEHYALLKKDSPYFEGLLADYSAGNVETKPDGQGLQKYYWWGLTERRG